MADTKISALPAGGVPANGEVFPSVQAAVTVKVTKAQLLSAKAGENFQVSGAAGQQISLIFASLNSYVQMDDAGNVAINSVAGFQFGNIAGGNNFQGDATGRVSMTATGMGVAFVGTAGGPSMQTNPGPNTVVFVAAGGMVCPYIAGVPGQWNIAPPPDYNTAINRLAAAVFGLLGGPIP